MSLPTDPRRLAGNALAQALRESRARTRALTDDLDDAQWQVPLQEGINPIAWELAHLAWFAEFWVLRGPHRVDARGQVHAAGPARHAGPDALLDSSRLPHAERWAVELPSRDRVAAMLDAQLEACLAALPPSDDDEALYFHRLALLHEDMHGEALSWLRQSLGYTPPALLPAPPRPDPNGASGAGPGHHLPQLAPREPLRLAGGEARIGWPTTRRGFAFDNELFEHSVHLRDFEIDATPVAAAQFLRFVEAGGYDQAALWPGAAGRWRAAAGSAHPKRWRRSARDGGLTGWEHRWFDRWLPLDPDRPAVHVNAYEADAYCRWAGRRLPSAAEWEHAAVSSPGMVWGHSVWEWTADDFAPYPGFTPGPYRDYSAPWFGGHRELRGGSFATHARLHDPRYRNFFLPQRTDLFTGFRTAAP